ncbi:sucrose transporter [Moniliophthora roreri MCA 2997]|uniref:Sucrose transporter n=1 Tax=Moniliophthora roreri (strain MCA 2997) TaxID=1381753 RepID=V2XN41_MONRO|nr:sucrose transporter [Moniliophthora roreri MCA 2997]
MVSGGLAVSGSGVERRKFAGISFIRGPKWLHLPFLTISLLGVQIFWSIEMSYASPYLVSLGLSKSAMAIVFVAGPLSGLVMQPLIGVLADNSTSKWGRRRPYMLLGTAVCIAAMLLLGWTKVVSGWFSANNTGLTIALAVLAIYLIDFSINAVQAVDRALLVDTLSSSLQPAANAWAAKMLAIGSVLGFFLGNLELPDLLPFLGSTQLEVLSVMGCFILLATHMTTAALVSEKVLVESPQTGAGGPIQKLVQELKDIWNNILTLPRVIRQICIIQFFSWLGWFPILFYTSVYIGDLHKRAFYATAIIANPILGSDITPETLAEVEEESTRLGSRALFYASLITLVVNFVLPFFVTEASSSSRTRKQRRHQQTVANGFGSSYDINGARSGMDGYSGTPGSDSGSGSISKGLTNCAVPERFQLHLSSLWALGHAVFAACMFGTFFTSSVAGATTLVAVTGFSWAVTQWAPFALLGEAILSEPAPSHTGDGGSIQLTDTRRRNSNVGEERATFAIQDDSDSDNEEEEAKQRREEEMHKRRLLLGNSAAGVSKIDIGGGERGRQYDDEDEDVGEDAVLVGRGDEEDGGDGDMGSGENGSGLSAKAGIILGIHNIFIVVPQFVVTGLSSIIFAFVDPSKSAFHGKHPGNISKSPPVANATEAMATLLRRDDSDTILEQLQDIEASASSDSVVYIFRIGGIAALVAFILCWRLARELRHQ